LAHSFGGRIAAVLAAGNPERVRRILFTGSAGIPPKKTLKKRLRRLLYKPAKLLCKVGLLKKSRLRRFNSADYNALPPGLQQTFLNVIREDVTPCLGKISCRTLLVWGEKDKETPLRAAKKYNERIRGSLLVTLPGAGHYAFLDDFPAFTRLADAFLTGENAAPRRGAEEMKI
jgi:pimeloyl-ACP methyl ester carboxylesterase